MITTRVINTEAEIVSLREKWDKLVEQENLDLTNSFEWAMCLLESHLGRKALPTIVVEEGDRILGIFPFFIKVKSINLIPVMTICPVSYLHSVHNDMLLRRGRPEVLDCIFSGLKEAKEFRNWKTMEISAVVEGGETDRMLKAYLGQKGYQYRLLRGAASPFIEIGDRSWEEYLRSRTSKIRGNFKRRQKSIKEAGKVEIKLISDSGEVLQTLIAVENNSWKFRDGLAITSKKEQLAFYKLMLRRLSSQVIFLALFLDGVPVSYTLCVVFRNKCYFLKTSYDERFRQLSPGIVVLLDLLKYCFDNKLSEFDFAGEAEEHKLDFTNEIRFHNHYLIFNKNFYSRFVYKTSQIRERLAS